MENKQWDTCDQPITYGEWLESHKDLLEEFYEGQYDIYDYYDIFDYYDDYLNKY